MTRKKLINPRIDTRALHLEVFVPDTFWRKVDDPDFTPTKTEKSRKIPLVFAAMRDLRLAVNRVYQTLFLLKRGLIEFPPEVQALSTAGYQMLSGKWRAHDVYSDVTFRFNPGGVLNAISHQLAKKLDTEFEAIEKGERTLSSWRKQDVPLTFATQAFSINKDLSFSLKPWDKPTADKLGYNRWVIRPHPSFRRDKYKVQILEGCLRGECVIDGQKLFVKMGEGKLKYDRRKKKWFWALAYTAIRERGSAVKDPVVAGIDLGQSTTVTMGYVDAALGNTLFARDFVDLPQATQRSWDRVERERRERLRTNREEFHLREGRGLDRKLRPIAHLQEKYLNVSETAVQQVAAAVVEICRKRGVVAVGLEGLTHWSVAKMQDRAAAAPTNRAAATVRKRYLQWHQAALRTAIKSALNKAGIWCDEVHAANSSRTCHACGKVYPMSLPGHGRGAWGTSDWKWFYCTCPEIQAAPLNGRVNADVNASRVLAQRTRARFTAWDAKRATEEAQKTLDKLRSKNEVDTEQPVA